MPITVADAIPSVYRPSTKIIATMGPATASIETLVALFNAGVNVCRLNFSHGDLDAHGKMLALIREAEKKFGRPVAVLGDLCGPKIRLGKVADIANTGGLPIDVGDELVFVRGEAVGNVVDGERRVTCTYPTFVDDVQVGHRVLVEDGLLRFVCTEKTPTAIRCRCTTGGVLKSSKGVNLPNTSVNVPTITDRDWRCVDWAAEHGLDYVALSFVRRAEDLHRLREHLQAQGSGAHLIAKIERAEAVRGIEPILEAADGLMVARGDLGVEMDVADVPIVQKDLVRLAQAAGKPVIVATQMLQSMVDLPSPTRAEVSDVANAIFDGTDAIMLSAETSVGKFPVGAVHVMNHVSERTEGYLALHREAVPRPPNIRSSAAAGALARGVLQITTDLDAKLVVCWTTTGNTARVFAKYRFPVPVIAMSDNDQTLRRAALYFSVVPERMAAPADLADLIARIDPMVKERGYAHDGDRLVLVAGWSPGTPGTMNGLFVHTVGQPWAAVPTPGR